MAETTGIEWCDATFNPWVGCTQVSPACDRCYAMKWDARWGGKHWGPGALRRRTADANWRKPLKWAREMPASLGRRPRIFGGSLCDVFDNEVPKEWRDDYWHLIRKTPELDWLLLTKRPQNIRKMVPKDWANGYRNVWLGTTAENRKEAERRIPVLLRAPAIVHFLSCEPLLEDISDIVDRYIVAQLLEGKIIPGVDWVIAGGESGAGWREMREEWPIKLHRVCSEAGKAFFMKQMAGKRPIPPAMLVRQFPTERAA